MSISKFPSVVRMEDHRRQSAAKEVSQRPDLFQGVPIEAPSCPQWLSAEAKRHWRYMVKHLKEYGLISRLDQGSLANLCTYYARAKEAEEHLQEHGEFQETPNGYVQISPYSVAFTRYSKMYNVLAKQFGMTPMARKGVAIDNPNQTALDLD